MEALAIPTTADVEIRALEIQALAVLSQAEALAVVSEQTKASAIELTAIISGVKRTAEARRVNLVKPHNDYVNGTNALWKRILGPILKADELLRNKVLTFNTEQRRRAEEAAAEAERIRRYAEERTREAERVAAAGDTGVALALVEEVVATEERATEVQAQAILPIKTVTTAEGKASTRKTWTFRVENLDKVPREYLCLDETIVKNLIRDGARKIDGLEIYEVESLTVQAARREPW